MRDDRLAVLSKSRTLEQDDDCTGFLFSHLRAEFSGEFEANRVGLARMIDAISEWLEIWIARSVPVTIVGV